MALGAVKKQEGDAMSGGQAEGVSEIISISVRRGYHPVATVDETDNSLEIEARLDPDHLLLLQVWPSGAVEGLIFSEAEGCKVIGPTTVDSAVDWLRSEYA